MDQKKILVVENEDPICEIYARVLRNEGYDVETFVEGDKALRRVRENHFDLVITDLKMPKVDGMYVIRKVRELSPNTEIMVITGYATIDSVVETIKLGASDYILKPFEIGDLVEKVRKILGECTTTQTELTS